MIFSASDLFAGMQEGSAVWLLHRTRVALPQVEGSTISYKANFVLQFLACTANSACNPGTCAQQLGQSYNGPLRVSGSVLTVQSYLQTESVGQAFGPHRSTGKPGIIFLAAGLEQVEEARCSGYQKHY